MGKRTASLVLLSVVVAIIASCSQPTPPKTDPNVMPARYKDEIIDSLQVIFKKNETGSITNAMISDPALRPAGSEQHYVVCVRYTAHGTAFNLTANAERIAYFYGGHLNQLVEAGKDQCGNAAYKPFPELNAVCIGKGCQ